MANRAIIKIEFNVRFDKKDNPIGAQQDYKIDIEGKFNMDSLYAIYANTVTEIMENLRNQIITGYNESVNKQKQQN